MQDGIPNGVDQIKECMLSVRHFVILSHNALHNLVGSRATKLLDIMIITAVHIDHSVESLTSGVFSSKSDVVRKTFV